MFWRRWQSLFVVLTLVAGVAVGGSVALRDSSNGNGNGHGHKNGKGQKRQDRAKNGDYNLVVAGNFTGNGTANVSEDAVSIQVSITDDSGGKLNLNAQNLPWDGPYFSGTTKIKGRDVAIYGRVDAARASRLIATFSLPDGSGGRIIGTLPESIDPPDDNWKDGKGNSGH